MVCKLCQKQIQNGVKIRRGYICRECFLRLPDCIKKNIDSFSSKHLTQLMGIIRIPSKPYVIRIERVYFTMTGIQINNWEINIKDIRNISLNFHPFTQGASPNTCYGIATIVIETRCPHFLLEEPIKNNLNDNKLDKVIYRIEGNSIIYFFPSRVESIIRDIQIAIEKRQDNLLDVFRKYGLDNSNRRQKQQTNNQNRYSKGNNNRPKELTPLDKAKRIYGITGPFTKTDLDKRKRCLVKRWHPDVCENREYKEQATEMVKAILASYDLLLPYAKKE